MPDTVRVYAYKGYNADGGSYCFSTFKEENDCGSWSKITEGYVMAVCANDNGLDTTSWTLADDIGFDWRSGYEQGMPTSFDYMLDVYLRDNEILNSQTKPVLIEVRCG